MKIKKTGRDARDSRGKTKRKIEQSKKEKSKKLRGESITALELR